MVCNTTTRRNSTEILVHGGAMSNIMHERTRMITGCSFISYIFRMIQKLHKLDCVQGTYNE